MIYQIQEALKQAAECICFAILRSGDTSHRIVKQELKEIMEHVYGEDGDE